MANIAWKHNRYFSVSCLIWSKQFNFSFGPELLHWSFNTFVGPTSATSRNSFICFVRSVILFGNSLILFLHCHSTYVIIVEYCSLSFFYFKFFKSLILYTAESRSNFNLDLLISWCNTSTSTLDLSGISRFQPLYRFIPYWN